MGLDVYLARSDNWDESLRILKISDELEEKLCKNRPEYLSEEEFHNWRQEKIEEEAKSNGLEVAEGYYANFETGIEEFSACDSEKYPEHLFKVGYFRSAYNGHGINTVLSNLGIYDLYDIFQVEDSHEYYIPTDWEQALVMVNKALEDYRTIAESGLGFVNLKSIRMFSSNDEEISASQAILRTRQELADAAYQMEAIRAYGNRHGSFYLDGLDVVGVFRDWLVYRRKEPDFWYLQALEIVKETIEFVLSRPNPENWRLLWSS